ncbi:unnamed protein product [Musa acuminata subsp. malaccensis]|uniref:(wild Malaysian banana) hypothetical protein n=1 Tax=Musa acuminata subsp. malaccensis TaxID=214687 RepID=A0A804ICL3_MUSAM|nr:PREDICTED: wall-associated receptor kinase-like 14 [Musa acuminata subsp. malaccensis]CAG1850346.1 unnamed protein product [Musa acuminata subsp. malaccensis]
MWVRPCDWAGAQLKRGGETEMLRFQRTRHRLLLLSFLVFLADTVVAVGLVVSAQAAKDCERACGSYAAPYPFGFSDGCPIHLGCSNLPKPTIRIGEFTVRNITDDGLLVDVPPACNRSVHAARSLFGNNYALSRRNGLFLRNCTPTAGKSLTERCSVDTILIDGSCGPVYDNATCLYNATKEGFFNADSIAASGCGFLFTTIGINDPGGVSVPSLDLSTAELAWWLEGTCRCAADANCTTVTSPVTHRPGFRCGCSEGFQGDGFIDGTGCRRVSDPNQKCNPTKYMTGGCGGTTSRYGFLVGGIIAGASAMAALAAVCWWIKRHSSLTRKRKSMRRLLSEASCAVPLYSYKDMEKATDGFSADHILGTGAFGTVYAGMFSHDRLVAVKKIKNLNNDSIEQVMNEIRLLSSVSHPNLVRLLGCCVEQREQILVYEYMPHGTLAQHLQRVRGPVLPWTVRLTIAAETAKAIAYLHSAVHPPIYHRDIKSSNILLDHRFNPKVADFGLSRMGMTEMSHISTAPQGTPGYLDPQYHQNFQLSDKSDVYSFGVVLTEIITALKAVDFSRAQSEVYLAALAVDRIGKGCIDDIIDPHLAPHRDPRTLASIHKVAELAFRCLAFHRDMRPSMTEVADELEQIRLSGWVPTDGSMFLSKSSSSCSSPSSCNEKPRTTSKSRRLASVSSRGEEVKGGSPVSVQEPWFSDRSSLSENNLLGNAIH